MTSFNRSVIARGASILLAAVAASFNADSVAAQGHHAGASYYGRAEIDWSRHKGVELWSWEASGWLGGDFDRFWWGTSGGLGDGELEGGELSLMYGRYVATFWDLVIGYRRDLGSGGASAVVAGITGLAPYWFEIEVLTFLGEGMNSGARLGMETDLLFTQRLIMRPDVRLDLSATEDVRRGINSGVDAFEAGVRTRYEFTRRFAPYLDLRYEDDRSPRVVESGTSGQWRVGAGLQVVF